MIRDSGMEGDMWDTGRFAVRVRGRLPGWIGRTGVVLGLFAAAGACQPEADLNLLLVDDCPVSAAFAATASVGVKLLGNAGFTEDTGPSTYSGCEQNSVCLDNPALFAGVDDFEALHEVLQARGVLLTASPGTKQAIVVTGYRSSDCRPERDDLEALTFCGLGTGPFVERDFGVDVLLKCPSVYDLEFVCWDAQFFDDC